MSRTVTIDTNAVDAMTIAEKVGFDKLQAAIGYLSLWNMGFDQVSISLNPAELEMTAIYTYGSGAPGRYVIGAIWHDDHFGFHS